jgi:hypothetical protein
LFLVFFFSLLLHSGCFDHTIYIRLLTNFSLCTSCYNTFFPAFGLHEIIAYETGPSQSIREDIAKVFHSQVKKRISYYCSSAWRFLCEYPIFRLRVKKTQNQPIKHTVHWGSFAHVALVRFRFLLTVWCSSVRQAYSSLRMLCKRALCLLTNSK